MYKRLETNVVIDASFNGYKGYEIVDIGARDYKLQGLSDIGIKVWI